MIFRKARYIGYHGTDGPAAQSIQKENFRVGRQHDGWLGDGAYFFIDGLGNPSELAQDWAYSHAWDNATRTYEHSVIVVLKVICRLDRDKVLDLSTDEGKRGFEAFRKTVADEVILRLYEYILQDQTYDYAVCNLTKKVFGLDGIIHDLFIKAGRKMRDRPKIRSRIPNSRVLVVTDPSKSIRMNEIKTHYRGRVSADD